MAILLSSFLPNISEDVVKITTGTGENERQVFVSEVNRFEQFGIAPLAGGFLRRTIKAEPLKANIIRTSRSFQHPLENSTTLIDHRILLPIIIIIPFLIIRDYNNSIYEEIEDFYREGTLVSIYTKARKYNNFYIDAIPHEESPERSDALLINVTFKQVQVAIPGVFNFNPQDTEQVNSTQRGIIDFIDIAVANLTINL